MALWAWQVPDPIHFLPNDPGRNPMGYGDVLEVTWGLQWYDEALLKQSHDLALYPGLFAPDGWQVGTLAHGPGLFLPFMLFVPLGGSALAYNLALWTALVVTYFGLYRLSLRYLSWPWAIGVAVFATFWSNRWMRIGGQPNLLLGAALLPWIAWSLERAWAPERRAWVWMLVGGLLWGYAITCSLYFIWLGAVTVAAWALGATLRAEVDRRRLATTLLVMGATAMMVGLPYILWFRAASSQAGSAGFDLNQLAGWGASLNSIALPFARHPISALRDLTASVYHGPASEAGTISLGPVAVGLALAGVIAARRQRTWWPVVALTVVGLTLALGPYLKWDDRLVQVDHPVVVALNSLLWSVGHVLKPQLFLEAAPPASYAQAIPLPALAPLISVPFWEGARISARYALVGGIGAYLLAVWVLSMTRRRWLRWGLLSLMLIEWWPAQSFGVPYPLVPQPVFAWVREHTPPDAVVADVYAGAPGRIELRIKPQILTATLFHERAALSGTSSVLPAHAAAIQHWLGEHPAAFADSEFKRRLLADQVGVVLIHVINPETQAVVDALANQTDWTLVGCFDPAPEMTPWPYPICVVTP